MKRRLIILAATMSTVLAILAPIAEAGGYHP
jgi:hypothetical protein